MRVRGALVGAAALICAACGPIGLGSVQPVPSPSPAVVAGPSEPLGEPMSSVVLPATFPTGSDRLVVLSEPERAAAVDLIEALPVRGRGPRTDYQRELFGDTWSDDAAGVLWAGNSCRTRDDVLVRDLDGIAKRDACVVISGTFVDPYSGTPVTFTKETAAEVPVDHLWPLSFGWQMGAAGWSAEKRLQFANDPLNLVLTTRTVNEAKRDSNPASWLPPNKPIRCAYVQRFALVAVKYQLPVTEADRQIMVDQCAGPAPA